MHRFRDTVLSGSSVGENIASIWLSDQPKLKFFLSVSKLRLIMIFAQAVRLICRAGWTIVFHRRVLKHCIHLTISCSFSSFSIFCSQNTVTQTCHSICSKWHFFSFLPSRLLKPPRGNDNSQIISVSLLSASFGSVDPIPIPSQSFLTSATVKIRNLTWMTSSFQAVASTKAYRFTKSHKKPQLCIILPRFF